MELANRSIMTMQNYKPFNKLDAISAAPQWDATATYHKDDPVVYKGRCYRCNTPLGASVGTWIDAEWTAVSLTEEIDDKAPLVDTMRFSEKNSYSVGDVCFYNGAFYRCKVSHTAGSWGTGADFEEVLRLNAVDPTDNKPYPVAPTPAIGDNSTKVATTEYVMTALGSTADVQALAAAVTALSQRGYVINDDGQPIAVFPDGTVPEIDGQPLRYTIGGEKALIPDDDEASVELSDRTLNIITIASGFSTLNLIFPNEIPGKVRDFYMRVEVAAGQLAPSLSIPAGITIETLDGQPVSIASGDTSATGVTMVYFTETKANTFFMKSDSVKTVSA